MGHDDEVDAALLALREVITRRVQAEQLRDQLTGLGNQVALRAEIEGAIARKRPFWIAFLEINRFKSVNDRFGHDHADAMLLRMAQELIDACGSYLVGRTQAFRAHGDEYFLVGRFRAPADEGKIGRSLERVRDSIAGLIVDTPRGPISITVSIGWLMSSDPLPFLRYRAIIDCLERAVSVSKKDRKTVCRFDPHTQEAEIITIRSDCPRCSSKWSLDLERRKNLDGEQAYCPNCGSQSPRPVAPAPLADLAKLLQIPPESRPHSVSGPSPRSKPTSPKRPPRGR